MVWFSGTVAHRPRVAALLGEITARWTLLEGCLTEVYCHHAALDWELASQQLAHEHGTNRRFSIVEKALSRSETTSLAALGATAISEARMLSAKRDGYTHHNWHEGGEGLVTFDHRSSPDSAGRSTVIDEGEMESLCHDIARCCAKLLAAANQPWRNGELMWLTAPLFTKLPSRIELPVPAGFFIQPGETSSS